MNLPLLCVADVSSSTTASGENIKRSLAQWKSQNIGLVGPELPPWCGPWTWLSEFLCGELALHSLDNQDQTLCHFQPPCCNNQCQCIANIIDIIIIIIKWPWHVKEICEGLSPVAKCCARLGGDVVLEDSVAWKRKYMHLLDQCRDRD